MTEEMVPEYFAIYPSNTQAVGLHIGALSSLTNLRELEIDLDQSTLEGGLDCDHDAITDFILACSNIRQLTRLSSHMLFDWGDISQNALVTLCKLLTCLTELCRLIGPKSWHWRMVRLIKGPLRLQKLVIHYSEPDEEALESLVLTCYQPFLSRVELELHFINMICSPTQVARVISGLKGHPSRSTGDNQRLTDERQKNED